ncbi:hypothetical protein ACH5RR_015870 [Cinchona calisaya]|uniref:Uncharacterized protein n=1 Tax=Cinchona calisaya TaxID=153742 RepID=A0ABD2ZUA4_9GENT
MDIEKSDINGITLDLDINSHLEAGEVIEPQDESPFTKDVESLTNTSHQLSVEHVPILEPELPRNSYQNFLLEELLKQGRHRCWAAVAVFELLSCRCSYFCLGLALAAVVLLLLLRSQQWVFAGANTGIVP